MTRKRERAFAGFGAALFLLTSSFFTIFIIYTLLTQNNSSKPKADTTKNNSSVNQSNPTNNQPKLAGTKLANFTPVASIPSLQTIDSKVGTGTTVTEKDKVTVNYTGAVAATGTVFQSSLDSGKPVTFPLNGVITGWSKGIPGMKVGGTRRLLIPAAMAYGANPPPGSNIPANADLVFDVTLLGVSQ